MSDTIKDVQEALRGFKFRKVDYRFKNKKERTEYFDRVYDTDTAKFKRQLKEYLLENLHVWLSWSISVMMLSICILLLAPAFTALGMTAWSLGAVFASLDVMLVHLALKGKVYTEFIRYDRVKKFLSNRNFKDRLNELINDVDASPNRKER